MVIVVALALMMGAVEGRPVRLIPFVSLSNAGDVQIRVENPSPESVDAMLTAELVLAVPRRAARSDTTFATVAYYARLDLQGHDPVPATEVTRLQVAARESRTWTIAASGLRWFEKVGSAQSEARPCRQIVPPGHYVLSFWVRRGATPWWRSQMLPVDVDNLGRINVRATDSE